MEFQLECSPVVKLEWKWSADPVWNLTWSWRGQCWSRGMPIPRADKLMEVAFPFSLPQLCVCKTPCAQPTVPYTEGHVSLIAELSLQLIQKLSPLWTSL